MNKRLPEEIYSIVKKLEKAEQKAFEKYSLRKKPDDGKEHRYFKLFNIYVKQIKNLEFDEKSFQIEAKKISNSINDLNQKLHSELLKFLGEHWNEKNIDESENKISCLLDISIALHEKGLYNLSAKNFLSAIKLLREVQQNNMKERMLYLSLKAYAWVLPIKFKISCTQEEERDFKEFEEFVRPFTSIAREAYSALAGKGKLNSDINEDFDKATFYSLLNIYFREKEEFEQNFKGRGNYSPFPMTAVKERYKQFGGTDNKAELVQDSIIDSETYLFQLERLYKAILANDSLEFDNSFDSIRQKLFQAFSLTKFNADLLLFVYRQVFELKTIYTLANNKKPLDINSIKELQTLSLEKMELFHENEIGDFALRVELNSFVILFLEGNFKELLKRIIKFEKEIKKDLYKEYFADLKLMDIISRIESGGAADEELEKRIDYYENYTKKFPTNGFHKKFDGFIRGFWKTNLNERKNICKKYFSKLEYEKESFNHFHSLFLFWVKQQF